MSISFGSKVPKRRHLVRGKKGVAGEVTDLRNDVEEAFTTVEGMIGAPMLPIFNNMTRPNPALVPPGTAIFNSDDNAPNYSDGTTWLDAMGSIT